MSIAEVKNLRNLNRFEDAYRMSLLDMETNQGDIWMKRNHAWSIYYMIKKHVQAGESQKAKNFYMEFEKMKMPEDEKLLYERMAYFKQVLAADYISFRQLIKEGKFVEAFDLHAADPQSNSEQTAWAMYYLARNFNQSKNPDKKPLDERLNLFIQKTKPEKKLVYKLLLQEFIKVSQDFWIKYRQSELLEFLGLFDVLEEEDYQKQDFQGKKIISLAERLHIAYSKALIKEKASKDKVATYLRNIVANKLEIHKGMLYVPFFKAKLLLEIGDREEGMRAFLPFARKKQGEFWVWQVFAEYHQDNHDLYLSCLCKAMTCKVKAEFLSGIKERLIIHLVALGNFDWAKSELDGLVNIRQKQGWGLRTLHKDYLQSDWYGQSAVIKDLGLQYEKNIGPAESLLGDRLQDSKLLFVVEYVNTEKKVFNFITAAKNNGYAKYRDEPNLGGIYQLEGSFGEGGFFKVVKMQEQNEKTADMLPVRKTIAGNIKIQQGKPFGFVENVFVSPALVKAHGLAHEKEIKGLAVLGPVKGKSAWVWRMLLIDKEN